MKTQIKNKSFTVSAFILALSLTACGKVQHSPTVELIPSFNQDTIYSDQASKIIGNNDLVKVKKDGSNIDSNLRSYLNGFGIIDLGGGVCSGTHIGNGYVLTAGHCFLPEGQTGSLQNQTCDKVKVYWGYRGSAETGSPKPVVNSVSQCTQMIYAERTGVRDFAVFKVDQAPAVTLPISISGNRPNAGTKITIFGYPQGRPLEWSQYCQLIQIAPPTSQSSTAPKIEMFAYQCDTEPGNSGSSVLAVDSKSGKPVVIGIHDAGIPTDDYNLATYFADAVKVLKAKTGVDLLKVTQRSL